MRNELCECSDGGCLCCHGQCSNQSTVVLYRIDMEDKSGVAFCDGCADDAMESGVFGGAPAWDGDVGDDDDALDLSDLADDAEAIEAIDDAWEEGFEEAEQA